MNESPALSDTTAGLPGVVLTSRVRLARNLNGYPFPGHAAPAHLADVLGLLSDRARSLPDFSYLDMASVRPLEAQLLVERHLISHGFATSHSPRGLALSANREQSLMFMEEDHLRLQCLLPGLQLRRAYDDALATEQFLAGGLSFAFDPQFGYLTTCPSNVGTGLRASAMLHLPGLVWIQAVESVFQQVAQLGLAVRGMYGEGSHSAGHLVQISNQVTLGPSEDEIVGKVEAVCLQLVQYEAAARQQMMSTQRLRVEDRCCRSLAILQSARLLEANEALEHLSMIRLGVGLGLLPEIALSLQNDLLSRIQPAGLQMEAGHELNPHECDAARARLLREALTVKSEES